MNKLVIFDLDGTLLDSVPDIEVCLNQTLTNFGYSTHSREEITTFIGNGARNLVKRALPLNETEEKVDECLKYYNKIYTASGSPLTRLFDGIEKVINELWLRGYKIAILTNKPQITTDNIFSKYMAHLPISKVVGQVDGVKIKPDPTVTEQILTEFNVQKENAYFVGDGETDIKTAINAGIKGVGVLWGYRSKVQLEEAGATLFALVPEDLLKIIP